MQDKPPRHVAKVHAMKAHVTSQRNRLDCQQRTICAQCRTLRTRARRLGIRRAINCEGGLLAGVRIGSHGHELAIGSQALALRQPPRPFVLAILLERHAALVALALKLHRGKQTLGARKGIEQEVSQLRHLVERHCRLAYKHQVARERTHGSQAVDGQDCAHHSHNRIVHVPDAHRDRHHRRSIALCRGSRLAQVLVTVGKLGNICLLMVEDLDDFLPRDHLFDIAVERTQRLLLTRVELLAARARIAHVRHDGHVARHSDERKTPIENKHQDQRSHRLHGSLNHRCKAVVERLGNGVHVVGEKTHDVARPRTVKIGERERLDMRK